MVLSRYDGAGCRPGRLWRGVVPHSRTNESLFVRNALPAIRVPQEEVKRALLPYADHDGDFDADAP
jgi:hypothetical protein